MSVVLFVVLLSAVCMKPTEGLWEYFESALKHVPLYDTVAGSINAVVEWSEKVPETTNKALSVLKSKIKSFTGVFDGPMLVEIIDPKLNKDEIPYHHCLSGVKVAVKSKIGINANLDLHTGLVKFDDSKFQVVGSYDDEDLEEYKILKILFQFTDLEVPYHFTATFSRFFSPSAGFVVLRFKDLNTLIVTVKVFSETSKVRELLNEERCFIHVQQILADVSGYIDIADHGYNGFIKATTGYGLTEIFLKKISSESESIEILKQNVSEALFWMLKPVLSDQLLFCESSNIFKIEPPECLKNKQYEMLVSAKEVNEEIEKIKS